MANVYCRYDGYPRILKDCELKFSNDGVILLPHKERDLNFKRLVLDNSRVFDLISATIDGLLEDLIPGTTLTDEFLKHYETLKGVWVYYPAKGNVVRFADPFWHKVALLTRNSFLLRDQKMEKSWKEIRDVFDNAVIAVAGCSVGNNIIHAIVRDMRPNHIKIADYNNYKLTNGNRVPLTYEDFGKNKAVVTAEQIHALDPFIKISVYHEGVHEKNVDDFLLGNPGLDEPRATMLVEEVDDPELKILLRKKAREYKIPVVMATDLGSAVQIDVRRFDLDDTLPLVCFNPDDELYAAYDNWKNNLADKKKLFEFFYTMIGRSSSEKLPELELVVWRKIPLLFGGIPQLGGTAMVAGGLVAEIVARILLGWKLCERMFVAKHTFEVMVEGCDDGKK